MKNVLPENATPRIKSYILFLIVAIIWGIAGPVIKFTLGGLSPIAFLTYRFAISGLVSLFLSIIFGFRIPKEPKLFWFLLLYAFLTSTVSLGLLFLGFEKTTAIDATLIGAVYPIFVAVAGVIFLKEHITLREKIGIGIAFSGTAVTILEPILKMTDGLTGLTGNLLILASVFLGVATAIMAKVLLRDKINPATVTNASFMVGLLTTIPIALFFDTPASLITQIREAPFPYHLGVLFMALLSGNLAYWLWHRAQKTIEIGEGGLFAYLYPLISTPLAVFWLGEKITLPFIIGAGVIAVGVIIAEFKKPAQDS